MYPVTHEVTFNLHATSQSVDITPKQQVIKIQPQRKDETKAAFRHRITTETKTQNKYALPVHASAFYIDPEDGVFTNAFVMEPAPGEDLEQFLASKGSSLDYAACLRMALALAEKLAPLHEDNPDQPAVIHRDLKASNVMWHSETQGMTLLDFGLSIHVNEDYSRHGGIDYVAPEALESQAITTKADVYSVIVLIAEIFGCSLDELNKDKQFIGRPERPFKFPAKPLYFGGLFTSRAKPSYISDADFEAEKQKVRALLIAGGDSDPEKRSDIKQIIQSLEKLLADLKTKQQQSVSNEIAENTESEPSDASRSSSPAQSSDDDSSDHEDSEVKSVSTTTSSSETTSVSTSPVSPASPVASAPEPVLPIFTTGNVGVTDAVDALSVVKPTPAPKPDAQLVLPALQSLDETAKRVLGNSYRKADFASILTALSVNDAQAEIKNETVPTSLKHACAAAQKNKTAPAKVAIHAKISERFAKLNIDNNSQEKPLNVQLKGLARVIKKVDTCYSELEKLYELLDHDKFLGTNSSGIKLMRDVAQSPSMPLLKKLERIIEIAESSVSGPNKWWGESNFFKRQCGGRHHNVTKLYTDIAKLKASKNLAEDLGKINNFIADSKNTFVHPKAPKSPASVRQQPIAQAPSHKI